MRAVVCKEFGPPESLGVEQVPSPVMSDSQVRVRIEACGVNFPDTLIIENKYQFKPSLPFSPGGEVAGVLSEVGAAVEGWNVGDRVIAMCGWGGFVEEMVVDPARLMRMPEGMDSVTAAGFTMTYGTSHYALKDRANLQRGETLLVLGAAGGVGLSAVEIGKAMGARVIAAASSADKLEVCRRYGADAVIDYSRESLKDKVKELTGGNGADVIYDPVGGDYFDAAFRTIAWEGRYLIIGFAAGRIPTLAMNLVLLKGCQVVGVFWGSFTARDPQANQRNLAELARWCADGTLKPLVSATYPLEEASTALRSMLDRKAVGKIVLVTGHPAA
ncbi:MAG TPA: NADPH:quinone oxidoreductase family protein [Candidatus Binatia bacterium]